jgi:hypothetical protein
MKTLTRKKSRKAKLASLVKTYMEMKAVRRIARISPLLGIAAGAAAMRKKRRGGAQPA